MKEILIRDPLRAFMFLASILVIGIATGKMGFEMMKDIQNETDREQAKVWNNGICPKCKTEWRFKATSTKGSYLYHDTDYIYECENGHTIELHKLHE